MPHGNHGAVVKSICHQHGIDFTQLLGVVFTEGVQIVFFRNAHLRPELPAGLNPDRKKVVYAPLNALWKVPSGNLVYHSGGTEDPKYVFVSPEVFTGE